jgi:outer membrane lipoprotein
MAFFSGVGDMRRWQWLLGSLVTLLCVGCSHGLSPQVRQQVDSTLSLAQLRSAPETYKGRTVMLGGDILSVRNLTEGTLLEVLHKPLDSTDRPLLTDHTEGRFMALCEGYLEPAIYSKGRQITLAGRVEGSRTDTVGEVTYVYPLVSCLEVHLWPPRSYVTDYPAWWYYDYWWYPHGHLWLSPHPFWWRHHTLHHFRR